MTALRPFLFTLLAVFTLLLLWSLAEPYVIDRAELTATLPNLPESWEGERVAVIADMQVGMWLGNSWTVKRMVAQLIDDPPAAVLIAGDFVYHPAAGSSREAEAAVDLVKPLVEAGIPTYAVLGNHDYQMPTAKDAKNADLAARVVAALAAAGVQVLQNEAAPLALPGASGDDVQPLYLIGVGSHVAGEDSAAAALAQLPAAAPRLALMHHPASFLEFPAGTAPLAFAAHTHGGQFRIPFTPDWSWMTFAEEDGVHADGWIDSYGEAGNRLYVNRGIGFSVVPLRLNSPPELTLLTFGEGAD